MTTLIFTVPGPPQGKARHRTGKGHSYTPAKTVAYQNLIKNSFLEQCCKKIPGHDFYGLVVPAGPVALECVAYYPRPKSHFDKAGLKPDAPYWPLLKPDFDNVAKVIADSLNGLAYRDDKQVIDAHCLKVYQLPGCAPCVRVTVVLMDAETVGEHKKKMEEHVC